MAGWLDIASIVPYRRLQWLPGTARFATFRGLSGLPYGTRGAACAIVTTSVCLVPDRVDGLHAGERMVTYADVKAAYPNYQMPRGTYGWQPSTRTVNNGPGWAAAPKPPPRLTRTASVKLFIRLFKDRLSSFWNENGRHWLTEILIVVGLLATARIARRNHRRLRARIVRQRIEQARHVVNYPWFEMFWIDPVRPSRRQQVKNLLRQKRQEFIELARDRRSRPVLLRSILSDSVLTGLSLALLRTLWSG